MPIQYLDLVEENEEQLAAAAIERTSGGLTVDILNDQIATRRALVPMVEGGLDTPVCPELTNANPGSPHTIILEAMAWLAAQLSYKINQVSEQNLIAFANLFGIEPREATAATTTLRFTVDPPANTDVTIPSGTEVRDDSGNYVFTTSESLVIPYGAGHGDVAASRNLVGHTLLSPNVITTLVDSPAYVTSVTNQNAIDSGLDGEPLDTTLQRVSQFQQRGERIVTSQDLEAAILDEALDGNGIVRAFPFVRNGEFTSGELLPGYTTVVVMTRTGDNVDAATMQKIAAVTDEAVGNQFIYPVNPLYVEFDVTATVRLSTGATQDAVLRAAEANLRAFYAASSGNFGRPILRGDVIRLIEETAGIDRIVAGQPNIIAAPVDDTQLEEYQLPKVITVTLSVG